MFKMNFNADMHEINGKNKLIEDMVNAHAQGFVNDIVFICADGVRLSSNKSLLSIRSAFFATMFFGGFKNTIQEEVEFGSCTSEVLQHILNYIWNGAINLKLLSVEMMLNLMEISRMVCLELLYHGIEDYLISKFSHNTICAEDLLTILDFSILNNFDYLQSCTLNSIDQNLHKAVECPRFKLLTESSILHLLTYSQTSSESALFEAVTWWMKGRQNLDESSKRQMLDTFDLKRFSKEYLLSTVRKTGFYDVKVILDVLEDKIVETEKILSDTKSLLHDKMRDIEEYRWKIMSLESSLVDEKKSNLSLKEKLEKWDDADKNIPCYDTNYGDKLRDYSVVCLKMDRNRFINKFQFNVQDSEMRFSYNIYSSLDGSTWSFIGDYNDCRGKQTLYFPLRKMCYVRITFKKCSRDARIHSVVLMLDSKSGQRKNVTCSYS